MINKLLSILFGWRIARRIIRENPGKVMVYTLENVGDQCFELSYIAAYKEYHELDNVSVLTTNPNHPMIRMYRSEFDDIVQLSKREYDILFEFYKLDIGQIFRTRHPEIFSTYLTTYIRNDFLRNNLSINNAQIVKAIYKIPQDTPPSNACKVEQRENLERLIDEQVIVPGKTVILNPFATSCYQIPLAFFEIVAEKLQKKGVHAVTSVIKDQKPIRGTQGVSFSLEETYSFSKECGYIIGARSGFLDLAVHSGAVIASVDCADYLYSDCYRLEGWNCNDSAKSFRYEPNNSEKVAEDIVTFIIREMEKR